MGTLRQCGHHPDVGGGHGFRGPVRSSWKPCKRNRAWCLRLYRCLARLLNAVIDGIARDHAWRIEPEWLVWLPGVVSGFNLACQAVGAPGDGVFTATPVYPPFLSAPANTGRTLLQCPLVQREGRWEWDWDAVERTSRPTPACSCCAIRTIRWAVFTRHELRRIADIGNGMNW